MSGSLDPVFDAAGQYWGVDPNVLRAVSQTESSGDPTAVSKAGAAGLMGIMPATAQAIGVDPKDPVQSIFGGARVLRENLDHFGNLTDALHAYNGGWDKAKWGNPETMAYVGKVASNYQQSLPAQASAPAVSDPVSSPAPADPNAVDTSQQDAFWGVTPVAPAAVAAPAPPSQPGGLSIEQQDALWGVGSKSADSSATPKGGLGDDTPPVDNSPGVLDKLGAGIQRGLADVRDTATAGINYADNHVPALAQIDSAIGRPLAQGQALAGQEAAARTAYNNQYGDSTIAAAGRIGGNALATLPATVATGGVVNPLTEAGAGLAGNAMVQGGIRLAGAAASGAAQGAAAGAATSTGYGENPLAAAKTGAEFGGAFGTAGNLLAKVVPGTVGNALGGTAAPARANLASSAIDQYGIPLTAAQVTGDQSSRRLAQAATTMGGGNTNLALTQQQAFNRAVLKTVGVDAPTVTTDVMQQAKNQIGQKMDDVLAKAPPIKADNQFVSDLTDIDHSMQGVPESQANAVRRVIDNAVGAVDQNGEITPQLYQTLTNFKSPLSTAMASDDSTVASAASGVKDALDDAFSRSLAGAGRSDLADQWQAARFQYKNLKTIEPLVNKGQGDISPALLQGRVNTQFSNRAYQGAGDLGTLADIGQQFLKPLSSSGTPEQGFGLYNLVEGSKAGTQLLHGDVGGAASTAGAMLARPVIAKIANALVGSPMLGKAIVARSLGQASPLNNALAGAGVLAPAAAQGALVPTANLLWQRNGLAQP